MRKRLIRLSFAVLVFFTLQAVSQERAKPNREEGISDEVFATGQKDVATGDVECGIDGKKQHESSDVLASPDNRWLAFAGVTAERIKSESLGENCANYSRVWVWHRDHWRAGYALGPKVDTLGNGMRLRGWSADSRLIAFDVYTWQRKSDGDVEHSIVLLEPATGISRVISSGDFEPGPRCTVNLDPVGFTQDKKLLVRATDAPHLDLGEAWEDEAQDGDAPVKRSEACTERSELLLFEFRGGSPERISGEPPSAQFHGKSRGKMNKLWWVSSNIPKELMMVMLHAK